MNPPGVVVSTGFADTINVTEMFCICVSRLITTLPGYVPAASPLGLAVTVNWAGAEPPADEMESHAPVTVAVYDAFAEPFTNTICVAGGAPAACIPVGDRSSERKAAQIGGQHSFKRIDSSQGRKAGGQNRAGLIAGCAHRSLVLLEDCVGDDRRQHFQLGFALGEYLVTDRGMLHIKGNHLAQPEAKHREGLGGLAWQGIEVQHKHAYHRVGQHHCDCASAR